jgi:hypothetical protein
MSLIVPTEYRDALGALSDLFERALSAAQGVEVEVEGQLGFLDAHGGFDSGVPQQAFNKQLLKMESNPSWSRVIDWTDTHDYFFANNVRATKTADGDTFFVMKQPLQHVNVRVPERIQALRVSLKTEAPVQPPKAMPEWVRIKKRKSFVHKSFSFDFTYVWSGRTVEEANQKQPRYEIEIECRDIHNQKGAQYLALSLLMKLHDLLERDSPASFEIVV